MKADNYVILFFKQLINNQIFDKQSDFIINNIRYIYLIFINLLKRSF